jgi:hypothetical protein
MKPLVVAEQGKSDDVKDHFKALALSVPSLSDNQANFAIPFRAAYSDRTWWVLTEDLGHLTSGYDESDQD